MIIEDISKAKQGFRKDILKNLKLLPKYVGSSWISFALSGILFFYIEECYHYVSVANPNTVRCRELCQNIINDLLTNGTTSTTTAKMMTNESISSNKTLTNNTATTFQRLTKKCMDQCQGENIYARGPTCSLSNALFSKWMIFCFITAFTIGFGNVVPRSQLGRALVIPYAICLIPLATASAVIFGRVLSSLIKLLVVSVEEHLLARTRIVWFQRKFITVQVCACAISLVIHAYFYHKTMFGNQTYLDSVYFTFVTMSTIGFGDLVYDVEFLESLSYSVKVVLTLADSFMFYTSFSLLASIIGSLTSAETDRSDVKVRDKNAT